MEKQVYIIGAGDTGSALARELSQRGCAITLADRQPTEVQKQQAAGFAAVELDVVNESSLVQSGALGADLVVVATGKSVQAGIYAAMLLKHLGVRRVTACADTMKCAELLKRIGAHVVFPSQQTPEQIAAAVCAELSAN